MRRLLLRRQLLRALFRLRCRVRVVVGLYVGFRVRVRNSIIVRDCPRSKCPRSIMSYNHSLTTLYRGRGEAVGYLNLKLVPRSLFDDSFDGEVVYVLIQRLVLF